MNEQLVIDVRRFVDSLENKLSDEEIKKAWRKVEGPLGPKYRHRLASEWTIYERTGDITPLRLLQNVIIKILEQDGDLFG